MQIKRHVEALLMDRHDKSDSQNWSDEEVIDLVSYALNEIPHDPTSGYSAFEIQFGELAQLSAEHISADMYVQSLQTHLAQIRDKVLKLHQAEVQRLKKQPPNNEWQAGDLTFLRNSKRFIHGRRWLGPYLVISQYKNDVKIQSLVDPSKELEVAVERLRGYFGTRENATKLARLDAGEHA